MILYLARHGESVPVGDDDERPLSQQGESDVRYVANLISPLNLSIARVFQSTKKRAQQTAQILSSAFHLLNHIETRAELQPMAEVDPIIEELYAIDEDILIVSHMPFLEKLVGKLITGNENKNVVAFKAGCLLCLEEIEQKQWVIRWMLSPELS